MMGRIRGKPGPKRRKRSEAALVCRDCGKETVVLYDGLCPPCHLKSKRDKSWGEKRCQQL